MTAAIVERKGSLEHEWTTMIVLGWYELYYSLLLVPKEAQLISPGFAVTRSTKSDEVGIVISPRFARVREDLKGIPQIGFPMQKLVITFQVSLDGCLNGRLGTETYWYDVSKP